MIKWSLLIFIIAAGSCNSKMLPQEALPKEVVWTSEGLRWEYFQDVLNIEGNSHSLARISWNIRYFFTDTLQAENKDSGYPVSVYAVMIPSRSYVKSWANRTGLLEHEQLHFDIAEVGARRIRKEISETVFDAGTYKLEVAMLYQRHFSEIRQMQKAYDAEHRDRYWGRDYWRMKVGGELEDLKAYSGTAVFVKTGALQSNRTGSN